MQYPTLEHAKTAGIVYLQECVRYLPSPANDAQVEIMNAIVKRYNELKAANPADAVAASKAVGWR
jgi:hypothetical protein